MELILRARGHGTTTDLDKVGTPHFAQFVPLEDHQVGFFTVYDGSFDKYIADFTKNIGQVFDLLFKFTKGAPPSPCRKYLQEFIDFAAGANRTPIGFYKAYPGLSVQDIHALIADSKTQPGLSSGYAIRPMTRQEIEREPDSKVDEPQAKEGGGFLRRLFGGGGHDASKHDVRSGSSKGSATLELPDIQGFILRGYRMPMVRHFLLTVGVPAEARKLLGRLVSGDESDAPQITTAEDWHVGFMAGPGDNLDGCSTLQTRLLPECGNYLAGLVALEVKDRVPTLSFKSFGAFIAGAAGRADFVGDTGPSAPQNWIGAFWQRKRSRHVDASRHES